MVWLSQSSDEIQSSEHRPFLLELLLLVVKEKGNRNEKRNSFRDILDQNEIKF